MLYLLVGSPYLSSCIVSWSKVRSRVRLGHEFVSNRTRAVDAGRTCAGHPTEAIQGVGTTNVVLAISTPSFLSQDSY